MALCHCWHHQTRDSPAADSRHTDHPSDRRKPEGRRQIRNESCAKHVSIELLFKLTVLQFYGCVLLFDFIGLSFSEPTTSLISLRVPPIRSYLTSFTLEDFSDHFPSSTNNKLSGKTPLTPVGTSIGICPKLRYEHPAHPAVLLPSRPKGCLGKAF